MIKIISFLKSIKPKGLNDFLLLFAVIFAVMQGVYIYILKSSNERLEIALKNAEIEKSQMANFIKNQQIAINELETNISEKEALRCEITAQKQKIINISRKTKKERDEKKYNSAINDATSFIYARVREQNATK